MRVNVYSQELITDYGGLSGPVTEMVSQAANTGVTYSAVRLYLHSSFLLHHPPADDDRSAITFWLPRSLERRRKLSSVFRELARMIDTAPPETGLD
jgi:hypothetical protein